MQTEMKEVFCIECGEYRPFKVKTSREEITVRGVTFSYPEQTAYCCGCGKEIYVPEINDINVQTREDAYRKASHIISVEEINEILKKYNIGAGPLARLLGFGEVTINRYSLGQIPSREHSDRLYEIRASHEVMEELLEKNKEKVTPVAYQKCRKAIDRLNELYGEDKIEIVARYILCKTSDITPMALQKLLYYSQAFFHALFHEDLFTDDCQAWAYGPVFPDVYYRYRDYGYNPIDMPTDEFESDSCELTVRETEVIDAVIEAFGLYSGMILSRITHSERPWIEARGALQPGDRSVTVIDRASINAYFDAVIRKYEIKNPREIQKYSHGMLAQGRLV